MSRNSMASTSSSLTFARDHEKFDQNSITILVSLINQHFDEFLGDPEARKSVKEKCSSKLKTRKQEFFEFSEQSVISNLYWGIESIDLAIQEKSTEERITRLKNAEKMLQIPALLNEHGVTAEIPNYYLVCGSYFYLSLVRKLQGDEWQVAIHFLQALMVSPALVHTEFAPELCRSIFFTFVTSDGRGTSGRRSLGPKCLEDFEETVVSEALRGIARQYKGWLMYHQVMSYGDTSQKHYNKSQCSSSMKSNTESSYPLESECSLQAYNTFEKVHLLDPQESIPAEESKASKDIPPFHVQMKALADFDTSLACRPGGYITKSSNTKCLQDMLNESQSNTPIFSDSCSSEFREEDDFEGYADDSETSLGIIRTNAGNPQREISHQKNKALCSLSDPMCNVLICKDANQEDIAKFVSGSFSSSVSDLNLSDLEHGVIKSHTLWKCHIEQETSHGRLQPKDFQHFDLLESSSRRKRSSNSQKNNDEVRLYPDENFQNKQVGVLEKLISKLCFSEDLGKYEEDCTVEITTVYEMLSNKTGVKYSLLKDIILDQLLMAISTSEEEGVIRTSVSILSTIISVNKSVIEDIKKKGLRLSDLVTALKRNVYEAAILIHFVNPSPSEIKNSELLPILVEVICTSNIPKCELKSPMLTPPAASLMILEVLVTAFDYETNNMHLEAIRSPRVLHGLLNAPKKDNMQEYISLAAILVRCMRFDGNCRKQISQFTPVTPFISILLSNQKPAIFAGLEFFHEILQMPRPSAISLLQQIEKEGRINNIRILLLQILQSQPEYKLLAANLLLQLDVLEDSAGKITYREEAMEVLLDSLTCEETPATQKLSAFILSNLGGTYSWTGEPYTVAWLVKKTGLTSLSHKNMIRNIDWSEQSLQDGGTDTWCSTIARHIIKFGNPIFRALEKGLKSRTKRVAQECLTTIAWLGCEIAKGPDDLRYSACEILLGTIEQFVHPGLELEERLLACLCIYNYASGRAMQKLVHFSEGVLESLRRLSSITWMAAELLKVADYLQPNKWRISCVHTQVLEVDQNISGAVNALIYYKGELYSGYADGSVKVWDVKGQTATLVRDVKEHRKAVTCFSLFEPRNCLLSGSADKTIRIWQMLDQKLECIDVIATKEPIRSIETSGDMIFVVTQGNRMKVYDASKKAKDLYKKKNVKCIKVNEGKLYLGCLDLSIQEVAITNNRQQKIKSPSWSWRMKRKTINAIALYKDWLYSASSTVEGSSIKEWRRQGKPQMSIMPEKSTNVLAMRVVEDFIYLQCSSSTNSLQIWLRGTRHKVGRLSAGSKITSLLTANDMVLCGTETGLIKGWIPL